jgi:hypothetical protein
MTIYFVVDNFIFSIDLPKEHLRGFYGYRIIFLIDFEKTAELIGSAMSAIAT